MFAGAAGRRRRSSNNVRAMQLFHELKQQFPTVPDHVVSACVAAGLQEDDDGTREEADDSAEDEDEEKEETPPMGGSPATINNNSPKADNRNFRSGGVADCAASEDLSEVKDFKRSKEDLGCETVLSCAEEGKALKLEKEVINQKITERLLKAKTESLEAEDEKHKKFPRIKEKEDQVKKELLATSNNKKREEIRSWRRSETNITEGNIGSSAERRKDFRFAFFPKRKDSPEEGRSWRKFEGSQKLSKAKIEDTNTKEIDEKGSEGGRKRINTEDRRKRREGRKNSDVENISAEKPEEELSKYLRSTDSEEETLRDSSRKDKKITPDKRKGIHFQLSTSEEEKSKHSRRSKVQKGTASEEEKPQKLTRKASESDKSKHSTRKTKDIPSSSSEEENKQRRPSNKNLSKLFFERVEREKKKEGEFINSTNIYKNWRKSVEENRKRREEQLSKSLKEPSATINNVLSPSKGNRWKCTDSYLAMSEDGKGAAKRPDSLNLQTIKQPEKSGNVFRLLSNEAKPPKSPITSKRGKTKTDQRPEGVEARSQSLEARPQTASTPTQTTNTLNPPSVNLSLNVNCSMDLQEPRRKSSLTIVPQSPWCQEPSSPRSFTSVNLTLRPPSSQPQAPIDITSQNSSLTYSTSTYDTKKGLQSKLQITVGPTGGSVSSVRTRPRSFHAAGSLAAEELAPRRTAGSMQDLTVPASPVLMRQQERFENLRIELRSSRTRLVAIQTEVIRLEDSAKQDVSATERTEAELEKQLLREIRHLRGQCALLTTEVDRRTGNGGLAPLGETSEEFYRHIYMGQRIPLLFGRPAPPVNERRTPQPADRRQPQEPENFGPRWSCPLCTFQNHPLLDKCEQCDMARIVHGTGTEQSPTPSRSLGELINAQASLGANGAVSAANSLLQYVTSSPEFLRRHSEPQGGDDKKGPASTTTT